MPDSNFFIYIFTFPDFQYFGKIKLNEDDKNLKKLISAIQTIFDKEYFALIITKTKNLDEIFGSREDEEVNNVMYR